MWPKCCPSFKSATWDQDHFTHPYFVSGSRPALLAFKGWPTVCIPLFFFLFCLSNTSFVRVLLLGQLLFPHASRHEWGISGTWGVPEYSWRAGMHLSWVNASSLPLLRRAHTRSSRKIMHTQEVQGLVPYQRAHTHLTPHCSHSDQKRMLITYNRTHTHTYTQRLAFTQLIQLDFPP